LAKKEEKQSPKVSTTKKQPEKPFINDSSDKDVKLKQEQEFYQSNPQSYNGAIRDNYSWTQTIKDIDVQVKINSNIKSSKQVKVKIDKDALKVSYLNESGTFVDLINDKLAWKIRGEESTWSLLPSDHIHVIINS
jgi:hypothetical protein